MTIKQKFDAKNCKGGKKQHSLKDLQDFAKSMSIPYEKKTREQLCMLLGSAFNEEKRRLSRQREACLRRKANGSELKKEMDINKLEDLKTKIENDLVKTVQQTLNISRKLEGIEDDPDASLGEDNLPLSRMQKRVELKDARVQMYANYLDIVGDILNDYNGMSDDEESDSDHEGPDDESLLSDDAFLVYYFFIRSDHILVKASNGKSYYVLKGQKDPEKAANVLARQEQLVEKLFKLLPPEEDWVKRMKDNWNPRGIRESTPYNPFGLTSYIENKKHANLCLRDKRTGEIHSNENMMNLVLLHELTHLSTVTYGHNAEFKTNFQKVMAVAEGHGLVENTNFAAQKECFCGMLIDGKVI
eukprot:Nk52_evm7s2256 gene=Nk52_evmTU7s2256